MDTIPDLLPSVGYSDDLAVLIAAAAAEAALLGGGSASAAAVPSNPSL
ncbi:DUF1232 domain-containing protein [Rugamonas sp. FT107W]|uniref:DUF1232 domain-containing protein n=1 Tax=Duganella vulcania TaxID=2692166 RepID=A0A845HQT1_9BURK|nr:DUF1232 domain-containing protein [Duganella vulcania]